MFTLIVCLAVIALSGAVVLRIVLGEENQPATPPPGPQVQAPSSGHEDARPAPAPAPAPAARERQAGIRSVAPPARHRVRSAVLLVFLLATLGALLALAVAVAIGLLVMGMRAGVG